MSREEKVKAWVMAVRSLPRVAHSSPPPARVERRAERPGPLDERLQELERALEEAAERLLDSLEESLARLVDAQVAQILRAVKQRAGGKEPR